MNEQRAGRKGAADDTDKPARWEFASCVDRYLDRVYRFLLSMTGDAEMAADLTHDTFLRIYRAFAGTGSTRSPARFIDGTGHGSGPNRRRRAGR